MKAVVVDKKEIALATLWVKFKVNEEFEFKPGQYMFINLINPPYNDEKGTTRHFSIVNSPNEKGVLEMATRLRDSAFKKSLEAFPIGTEVEIQRIAGTFTLPEDTIKPLVFIAGGIGITPFVSMLRFINEEKLGYNITLLYSNRDLLSSVFLEELQELENSLTSFKLIATMTDDQSWHGEKRRINAQFIKEYLKDLGAYRFFVVGPPAMTESVENALGELGVVEENLTKENFTGY
ncbi:FAD-dependent oxidoreductase [Candidatus Daviesbacteria bacterium]|nr:FAD-dependent oxidoreductase [Candidatus Daviesbacteria bacterium]